MQHTPWLQFPLVHWEFVLQDCPLPEPPLDWQEPATHVWPDWQTLPQAPQLLLLFWRLTSQPLLRFPSQLAKPEEHTMPQVPLEQMDTPLLPGGQTMPQPPQLFRSPLVFTHCVPHSVCPDGQLPPTGVQAPPVQV